MYLETPENFETRANLETVGVEAPLPYLAHANQAPVTYATPPNGGMANYEGEYADHAMAIQDGRAIAAKLSLDRQGFLLVRHQSGVADFYDDDAVRAAYYPEVERLVADATGASRVVVFDHTRRADGGGGAGDKAERAPVRRIHNDYTEKSTPRRVRDLFDAPEAEALLSRRFSQINVWRPIVGPVRRSPLALLDAQSVAPNDLVKTDLVFADRGGENYYVTHNPEHQWFYFPDMGADEAVLIKGYDSATDGRARFTPHTSFEDPTTPDGAPPRESIEVRTFAFFED